MKTSSTFTTSGWDFTDVWAINSSINNGYPYLDGNSSGNDSFVEIYTIEDLQNIKNNPGANFIQMADIDASTTTSWNGGLGFEPIPDLYGQYDGNGYKVSNLYINRTSTSYVGLFAKNRGTISNFQLADSSISGYDYTGSLVGYNYGVIYRSKSYRLNNYSNRVVGTHYFMGGLVGYNYIYGSISESYFIGNVSTTFSSGYNPGGLVGTNDGNIANCYARGSISMTNAVYGAGLVGLVSATGKVSNSYAAVAINKTTYSKGLIGTLYPSGTVTNSFWDINVSGQDSSAAGTGTTTEAMKTSSTFTDCWLGF
jgi:hypothetical protein